MLALTVSGSTRYIDETEQEPAMKAYWEACQAGDSTARLVRVDQVPPDLDPRDPPPTAPGALSTIAKNRIARQEGWLTAAGFSVPPPIFAPGTRVLPLGDRNFEIERQRVENLPTFREATDRLSARIHAEDRVDIEVDLREARMDDTGALVVHGVSYALTEEAFVQLAQRAGFGTGVRYLTDMCDGDLRAHNVNEQLLTRINRKVVLRTRNHTSNKREVYAVVTPTYAAADGHEVTQAVATELAQARTELVYDGRGVKATALFLPDRIVDLAAGDIFKAGVRISTDDTGKGRVRIAAVLWRNRCLNLLVIAEGEVETAAQVHRGEKERILAVVRQGVQDAEAKIGAFLDAWGVARRTRVDVPTLLRLWVDDPSFELPRRKSPEERDRVVEALLSAWRVEPGDTLADAANALTRAAHTTSWSDDYRGFLERRAATLILAA